MTIKEFEIQLALGTLSEDDKYRMARSIKTSKKILAILATDERWWVRCWIAGNPDTPVNVLKILATDEDNSSVIYWAKKTLEGKKM